MPYQEDSLTLRKFQSLVKTTLFFMQNRNEFDSLEPKTLQSNLMQGSVLAPKKL